MSEGGPASVRTDYRTYDRVFEAMAWFAGQLHDGRLVFTDLSCGGAFLECGDPPAPGAEIEIVIAVADDRMLQTRARVVHTRAPTDDGEVAGAGLQFTTLTSEQRTVLAAAVAAQAEPAAAAALAAAPEAVAAATAAPEPAPEPAAAPRRLPAPTPATPPRRAKLAVSEPAPAAARCGEPHHRTPSPFATLHLKRMAPSAPARRPLARDLLASAKAAIAEGLYLRAAADLQLAHEYDPEDLAIATLAAEIITDVNRQRAQRAWKQGLAFEEAAAIDEAERSFAEAAALCPQHGEYQLKLVRCALRRRDLQGALERLAPLQRLRSRDPKVQDLLADVHLALGQRQLALEAAARAAKLDPGDKALRRKLKALRKT